MKFDTQLASQHAKLKLELFLERAMRDTEAAIATNDIPTAVTYFSELRQIVRDLATKMSDLEKHVETVSYEFLPTMFSNQDVKTINLEGVGRATVNVRWTASLVDKPLGLSWLRSNNAEGLIQETVNAQTLGAWAKDEVAAGKPPPAEIFKVSSQPYVSITKS